MQPTVGRIVHYKLSAGDAANIGQHRLSATAPLPADWPKGAQAHVGNTPSEGDVLPLVICRVWPNEYGDQPGVNGQVLLDGNDTLWVTSRKEGTEPGTWAWPSRV